MRTYLDNAATTPIDPRVIERMTSVQRSVVGNPSSLHREGREARRIVEDTRSAVARALGAREREIILTASATEANNAALAGVGAPRANRNRILVSAIEHPSVLAPLDSLRRRGYEVVELPVTPLGVLDLVRAEACLDDRVALTSLMWVNNEIGTIQPVREWARAAHAVGAIVHCDAVQAFGKIEVDVADVDLLSISAHKFHGPKGAAALYVREGTRLEPQLVGGGQERERRAGTENVAALAGLTMAVELAMSERPDRARRCEELEARLCTALRTSVPDARLNSGVAPRVPGLVNLRFSAVEGDALLMRLDLEGIAVSLGSACSSGSLEPSHVLRAMGLALRDNFASLRISLSSHNDERDVDAFVGAITRIVAT